MKLNRIFAHNLIPYCPPPSNHHHLLLIALPTSGLLNIRGADIPYNPLVFSILVFTPKETHLFIDTRKLNSELKQHLSHVCLHEYDDAIEWFTKWHEEERASNPTHMV